MGTGGNDFLDLRLVHRLDVLLRLGLIQILVANASGWVAVAGLLRAEDGKVDARLLQQPDEGPGDRPVRVVVGRGAADEIQILRIRLLVDPFHAKAARPVGTLRARHAVGVALALDAPQCPLGLLGEFALFKHQAATHIDDLGHVLDQHRAFLLAGPAGHARPDFVLLDRLANKFLSLLRCPALLRRRVADGLEKIFASIDDDHLGIERLAGEKGGALLLAAATFGARVQVEQVLPRPLGHGADPVVFGVLQIDWRQRGAGFGGQLAEEDVRDGDDDVQVLRARNVDEEGEHRQDVHPVEDLVRRDRGGALPAQAFEDAGQR